MKLSEMSMQSTQCENVSKKDEKIDMTVEEAREIADKLKDLSEGFFLQTGNIDSRAIELEICLVEKIEQAED